MPRSRASWPPIGMSKPSRPLSWAPCWWRPSRRAASRKVGAPWIRGINPQIETNMSVLPSSIVEGKFDVSDRGLLVGTEFARNMGLQVGDRVEIGRPNVLQKWRESAKKKEPASRCCRNTRCAGSSTSAITNTICPFVVISLQDAQDLYDLRQQRARVDGDAARPRTRRRRCSRSWRKSLGPELSDHDLDGGKLRISWTP